MCQMCPNWATNSTAVSTKDHHLVPAELQSVRAHQARARAGKQGDQALVEIK
jgi:hypothetical protein